MPTYVIEVERLIERSYRIMSDNETNARMVASAAHWDGYPLPFEEHEQQRIKSCNEVEDDD